ncbi:MAG TPA: hypothetical protein VD931_04020 [Baekduia sp.]|nr:hypothetical protein [Baekduia sp.]
MRTSILAALGAAAALSFAPAAHAVTGNQSVTADVANTLEATFPSDYAWGDLAVGAAGNTSAAQTVTVKSNALWGVDVSTDLADGRMKEWDGSAYVVASPKTLGNALQWRLATLGGVAQGTTFGAISSTPAEVVSNHAVTGDSGVTLGFLLKQVVSYSDVRVAPNAYRIQLSYDAAQGY